MQEHTPFDLPDRFWAKTREDENGCLIWTGAVQSSGYGCYGYNGRTQLVHRLVYMAAEGSDSIPQGWHIDHLCRVRLCVNIDHLEPVTPAENNRRMPRKTQPIGNTIIHERVVDHRSYATSHAATGPEFDACNRCNYRHWSVA